MDVPYIKLVKIDHDNDNVVIERIDGQENIKQYVMDMLVTISENIGEREYIFKDGEETMKTYLNNFINEDNKDEITLHIAKRLLSKEQDAQIKYVHITQIQKGIMLASLCKMTERDYKVIIAKADYSEFLEEASGEKKNGLPTKKKIFKSFIANVTFVDGKYSISKMVSFDVNSSQAKYWYNDFLDLEAKLDDETNTKKAFDEINARVLTPIKKESKDDYWCLYNATLRYMRSEGEFDIEYYVNEILGKYIPTNPNVKIKDLSKRALELPEKRNFDRKFTKVPKAIKKKIKAIIPLTEDISLSVADNSNPSLKNIIKPYEDEEGYKYIMVKSDEGHSYAKSLK
jgi:hypothetical protein